MRKKSLYSTNARFLYLTLCLALVVILAIPFVSAGKTASFWNLFTGAVTTDTTSVSVSINSAPLIDFVEVRNTTVITSTELTTTYINISFSAQDPDTDGRGQLNNNTAAVFINITKGGGPTVGLGNTTRYNTSCAAVGTTASSVNYSCRVYVWYFDPAGTWTVNVSVQDSNGTIGTNMTKTFELQTLTAMTMYPSSMTFAPLELGTTNSTSTSDPLVINNTGNSNVTNGDISITANDLQGLTTTTEFITARNFSIGSFNGSSTCTGVSCIECNRTLGFNNTAQAVAVANMTPGNNSVGQSENSFFGDSTGQETLYICLRQVATQLSRQTYDTAGTATGTWTVTVS